MRGLVFVLNMAAAWVIAGELEYLWMRNRIAGPGKSPVPFPEGKWTGILRRNGVHEKEDVCFYLYASCLLTFLCLSVFLFAGWRQGVLTTGVSAGTLGFLLFSNRIRQRRVFQKNAYRLYKYICNQTDAGVLPRDALTGMHEIVEDKSLKRVMEKVCGMYSATLDVRQAGALLLSHIDNEETRCFVMFLQQDILGARDSKRIERLETLMFNRYFTYIQRKTDQVKSKCMVTVVAFSLLIVLMILIPLFMEVQEALNNIFIT
ncbi:MAG: hypothetical protein R6W96_05810 [Clostridia bacterium]